MSGGGGANNSWTILTSEETVAETLRPFAAGTEKNEESQKSTAGSGENKQPAKSAESAEGLPVENYQESEAKTAGRSSYSDQHSPAPPPLEVSGTLDHGDEVSLSEVQTEGTAEFSPDPESDTTLTHSPDDPPPRGAEFVQAEEKLTKEETVQQQNEAELQQKEEESGQHPQTADSGKHAEVGDEATGEKREPEERRKRSLLAALEEIGRREEEEEEEEEEYQVPQQENSIFSLNKCILGAVILLGLGTIFLSESDHAAGELKDSETPGKPEWFKPEVPPHVDADGSELLNKLAEGNQQISALQAQLQAQKEELKVVKEQAAEGEKERLLWEELEKENSRLKTEMASLPVLQKENDRMKKELESVSTLQKELETLRSTVTKLKPSSVVGEVAQADGSPSASPPSGQSEDSSHVLTQSSDKRSRKVQEDQKEKKKDQKRDKHEKKQANGKEKSVRKEGDQKEVRYGGKKERKRGKDEEGMFDKEKDGVGKQKRRRDEMKDWERENTVRGDGKPWKDRKERKDGKTGKLEKVSDGKEWRGKEERKDQQEEKYHGERQKGEMEWKKVKDGIKESGREKWERKDWKEKGEKKEWKKNKKDHQKEGKRKQWEEEENHGKERTGKDGRKSRDEKQDEGWKRTDEKLDPRKKKGPKEKKHDSVWKKDQSHSSTANHDHREEEHLYGERKPPHSHRRPAVGQPEYWARQRELLRHDPRPPQHCNSPESCARAERLLPVTSPEFEAIFQTYLTKAEEEAGVDESQTQELRTLAAEFFKDGVFLHEQMSFQDFVEDLADILEDMVEGEEEEDTDVEEEMEEFEKEVMKRFSVPGVEEKEKRVKGEWRKESQQDRG